MENKVLEYNRIFTEMVWSENGPYPLKWRRVTLFSAGSFVPMLACIELDERNDDDWVKEWSVLDMSLSEAQGIRWAISYLDNWKRSANQHAVIVN